MKSVAMLPADTRGEHPNPPSTPDLELGRMPTLSRRRRGPHRTNGFLVCLVAPLLTAAACGGGSSDRSPEVGVSGGAVTTTSTLESSPEELRDAQALVTTVLADDGVTDSEMEQVLLAAVACVERTGFHASLDKFTPGQGYELSSSASTSEGASAADAELNRCREIYIDEVESLYSAQHGPSEAEIEANDQRIIECLADLGNDVDGLSVFEASKQVPAQDFATCEPG